MWLKWRHFWFFPTTPSDLICHGRETLESEGAFSEKLPSKHRHTHTDGPIHTQTHRCAYAHKHRKTFERINVRCEGMLNYTKTGNCIEWTGRFVFILFYSIFSSSIYLFSKELCNFGVSEAKDTRSETTLFLFIVTVHISSLSRIARIHFLKQSIYLFKLKVC